jgi:hypothetical protein
LRLGANGPVMRWGYPADDQLYASRRRTQLKRFLAEEGHPTTRVQSIAAAARSSLKNNLA